MDPPGGYQEPEGEETEQKPYSSFRRHGGGEARDANQPSSLYNQSQTGGKDSNANPVESEHAKDEEVGQDEGGEVSHRQPVFLRSKMTIFEFVAATDNVGTRRKSR